MSSNILFVIEIYLVLLQVISFSLGDETDPLLVTISSGKLRGKILNDKNGNPFYAFQKIPYGKKPIGDLRFKVRKPPQNKHNLIINSNLQPLQKPEQWNDTLDATQIAPDCLQDVKGFSTEDCIYLNVFTHRVNYIYFNLKDMIWHCYIFRKKN